MAESDGEIEYLDEDAEIVMQCVQQVQDSALLNAKATPLLLVERPRTRKRKKADDSDYDPSDEFILKKRLPTAKRVRQVTNTPLQQTKKRETDGKEHYLNRKKLSIRIPDYDDPLCLSVKAIKAQESDLKRLNNWNKVCLEHFKFCNDLLKPAKGDTKKSVRTSVFKNVVNKQTGSVETTIWSKTSVENVEGDKKSEIFQCVLPRYREKKVLNNYILGNRRGKSAGHTSEVILCKEDHKDGEALVVYNPKDSVSAVYSMVDKRGADDSADADHKRYMRERACCRLCAPCYQASWRGARKQHNRTLVCPICARTYVSIYNLLSHFKSHSAADLKKYRKIISCILSDVVAYHYKCRICRQKFDSIKGLRRHTPKHQSNEVFKCEVGNHLVNIRK